jgi:hypothetical protein
MTEQVPTSNSSIPTIMNHPHFARGLDDARRGKPFDADLVDDYWAYDRGRLFGAIAPLAMPLRTTAGGLNLKAIQLYAAASKRGLIR